MFHREGPTFFELVRQALSSTDEGYDLLAPKFEHTPFRTPDVVLEAAARALGPVDSLLDLCCGTGAAMRALRGNVHRQVVGVDRSAGMLGQAQRALENGGGAPFALVRGDALALPFRGAFDAVVSFGAFGHILEHDEPVMVAQVAKALKPGGRFVFATTDDFPPFHPAKLMAGAFNLGMRVRNALIEPKFVMYYLTFLLPRARALLEEQGFTVADTPMEKPYQVLRIVTATKGPR
jgi:ubiquinone/menaquinone biosynthesis C-methylase UbiE